MNTVGWLVAAVVAASAVLVCIWILLRARREQLRLALRIQNLTREVELQRDSLEALVESRDAVTDALGTMMLATSYSSTITSDAERREALILIARTSRDAIDAQRQSRLTSHVRQ